MKELLMVFLSAALPISEIRGAIPLGFFAFKLNIFLVYFIALAGNFIIVPFLLLFLKHFSEFLMHRFYFFNRFLTWLFERTRNHHAHHFEKWEHWALFILVAIPLPLTGAWTGGLCAFLFDIPFKKSLWLIGAGIMVAGLVVSGLSLFGAGAINGVK